MNLSAYDKVEEVYTGAKLNVIYKKLYTTIIKFRNFYSFLKKYDVKNKHYEFYLVLLDNTDDNLNMYSTTYDKDKYRLKFNLAPIWKDANLNRYNSNIFINIEHIEHTDDGDIYKLDI